ncbi:MAG: LL-diaminopimelate aminotransferase [Actinobacteria bacterium]|nr:LL-diaminopimelate aminotransferase [Actinomycetota bacterium]
MRVARRVESLPPYLFAELDRRIAERRAAGVDIISLGVGDPDRPTPGHVVRALQEAAADPATHRYPSYYGLPDLRRAIAGWYARRFGVELDPDTEVLPLIGSKEGIAHVAFAFLDPGDVCLVPDPGYPVYETAARLAGATPEHFPLTEETGFFPDLDRLAVPDGARMMWLNYPTNPTAAVADVDRFERAVAFAAEHDLLLAHDAAYTEITFDGYVAPSILQAPGSREVALEFGSPSKTYNMTGWRLGWAVGNAGAIRALSTLKTNLDSGIFDAVQRAGIAALSGPQDHLDEQRAVYQKRRDVVVGTMNRLGWDLVPPLGSIYVWVPTPDGQSSAGFADLLLDRAGVVVAPGRGYGPSGEGHVRISLTVPDDRLEEAMGRIAEAVGR